MAQQAEVKREIYEIPIAADFLTVDGLRKLTGQDASGFANVVVKELFDNALDACETAKVAPHIVFAVKHHVPGGFTIRVEDNAGGIEEDTVRRILNFDTRASDKSVWRSPTRGQQGNAFKTLLGIPAALGDDSPVIIESREKRHSVRVWKDAINDVQVEHIVEDSPRIVGTAIEMTVKTERGQRQRFDAVKWARAFALANPHVTVQFEEGDKHAYTPSRKFEIVQFIEDAKYKKWRPYTPTSSHWYDARAFRDLVAAHISAAKRGGPNITTKEFVRQFDGAKRTEDRQRICAPFERFKRLSDFESDMDATRDLLDAMQRETAKVHPNSLGKVGKKAIRARFDEWFGVKGEQFWYKEVTETIDGIPYVFEIALAETEKRGRLFHAINFSPTFDDFLARTFIPSPKGRDAYGLVDFLREQKSLPIEHPNTAVFLHLVSPVLQWDEYGKVGVTIPREFLTHIGEAVFETTRRIETQRKREEKRGTQQKSTPAQEYASPALVATTIKDAVFLVIEEAAKKATGNGKYRTSLRTLYYQVRPLLQKHTDKELLYSTFGAYVTEYQATIGEIKGLYYDPRGFLMEPHTGREIPLGTREVEEYRLPEYVYNKVLYVEKKGLLPILQDARIAERFDIAIVAGEGYATEAARRLLASAEQGRDYQIFVLHDADPDGYNIAITLQEETARMPGHKIEVRDIGLTIEQAVILGIEPENFMRKKDIGAKVKERLTPIERTYFLGGQNGNTFKGRRFELNALSAPQLIELIESGLTANGVYGKVIPPDEALPTLANDALHATVDRWTCSRIAELLDLDRIVAELYAEAREHIDLSSSRDWIEQEIAADHARSWEGALTTRLRTMIHEEGDALTESLKRMITDIVQKGDA